MSDLEEFFKE